MLKVIAAPISYNVLIVCSIAIFDLPVLSDYRNDGQHRKRGGISGTTLVGFQGRSFRGCGRGERWSALPLSRYRGVARSSQRDTLGISATLRSGGSLGQG